jgi:tRNA pseudouridine55 synthase
LSETAAYYLASGHAVQVPGAPVSGWVSLFDEQNVFLGVGEILDDGRVAPRRLVSTS